MNRTRSDIPPERLVEAAEAVLLAVADLPTPDAAAASRTVYPPDLVGAPAEPIVLKGYSRAEIEEATLFLVRLGVIGRPRGRAA